MTNKDSGTPSDATRDAEAGEAAAAHKADRAPTREEEQAAPDQAGAGTKEGYKEMAERGANVKGEGEIP